MIRFVLFRDIDPWQPAWHEPGLPGFNKVGYIGGNDTVIHPQFRWLGCSPLKKIETKHHRFFEISSSPENEKNIDIFFTQNRANVGLFCRGFHELVLKNFAYFNSPIKLPVLHAITESEFQNRWGQFASFIYAGDFITVIDISSLVSRAIAYFDQGVWSHIATYIGNGLICEAIPIGGVVVRNIEVYRSPRYRIGLYRPRDMSQEQRVGLIEFLLSQVGKKYSYRKLLRYMVKKLFGGTLDGPVSRNLSPNDLVLNDRIDFVYIV